MYNEVIQLVAEQTGTVDKYGNDAPIYTAREVLADIRSIGMREFYSAAQTDYKPECTAVLADYRDYDGEEIIIWNSEIYHLVRAYRNGRQLELTLERRIGDLDIEIEEEDDESE